VVDCLDRRWKLQLFIVSRNDEREHKPNLAEVPPTAFRDFGNAVPQWQTSVALACQRTAVDLEPEVQAGPDDMAVGFGIER
jgi:hypothetical protein